MNSQDLRQWLEVQRFRIISFTLDILTCHILVIKLTFGIRVHYAFALPRSLQPLNISDFQVLELDGNNYRLWKEKIILQLGWMDVDYAIRKDEPPALTDTSNKSKIDLYERWERSNCLSMMYIKSKISASIHGSLGVHKNVRDLLKAIDE
ncbi:putative RNA-directed DNA polymerase [Senna tora]|uniref:Putative RNA-directed DNA polymerase n=1 Tax=Senna tora TaxID=362788 RepID=A0A835CEZ1_9FABA|nr:putative RNA-directed DNA polymerase [Senna tora]